MFFYFLQVICPAFELFEPKCPIEKSVAHVENV